VFKPAASRACSNCHQPAQADWKTCPHCGQTL
jgi:RNA polymerase subunit RPABC4/transcription elongation factor Spt4